MRPWAGPSPGAKRRRYLEETWGAPDIVLAPDEASALADAFPGGHASGLQYFAVGMAMLDR